MGPDSSRVQSHFSVIGRVRNYFGIGSTMSAFSANVASPVLPLMLYLIFSCFTVLGAGSRATGWWTGTRDDCDPKCRTPLGCNGSRGFGSKFELPLGGNVGEHRAAGAARFRPRSASGRSVVRHQGTC